MSTSSFAGAPVSKALLSVAVACSIVAAVTSTQHLFHLPLVPHLIRDHQFYRLLAHHFVYANSAELLLGTLLLWQTSAEVERLFGTRKFAVRLQPDLGAPTSRLTSSLVPQSFLVVTTALSTAATAVTLLLGARLTRGQFNFFPSGPFAATAAILYQSHRLVPPLYHFRLFHPLLTFSNRFAIYLLAALLFTSNLPSSAILCLIGITSSLAYTSDFLSMRRYRISRRVYKSLAWIGGLVFRTDDGARIRRGTAVTAEEVLLQSLAAAQGGAAGAVGGGLEASALRSLAQRAAQPAVEATAPTPAPAETAEPPQTPAAPASTSPTTPSRAPRMGFLRQWQAGLTGAPEGPTAAQIAELTAIFPHHTRQAIVTALQENELDVTRAAEALLAAS
ncbi:DSC E3 ubiquitin ligase complex subunit 2 [Rhodotorula toruloides]|nr:DSC E3 ubiquitin ligase complex subunit 2 [Rhodotorula toruloides]